MLANLREILSKTLLNEFTDCFMLLLCNIFVFTVLLSYDCNLDPLENEMIHHKRLLQYSSKNLQQHQPITTTTGHTRPNETCNKTQVVLSCKQSEYVITCSATHVFTAQILKHMLHKLFLHSDSGIPRGHIGSVCVS